MKRSRTVLVALACAVSATIAAPDAVGATAASGSIAGTARAASGEPLAGVTVTAKPYTNAPVQTTTTAADGTFSFPDLAPNAYEICGQRADLIRQCTDDAGGRTAYSVVDGDAYDDADLSFWLRPGGVAVTRPGKTSLRWAWFRFPGASGYQVALSSSPTMSSPRIRIVSDRWVTFTGLTPGRTYYLGVRALDSASRTAPSEITAGRAGLVAGLSAPSRTASTISYHWLEYLGARSYQVQVSSLASFAGYRSLSTENLYTFIAALRPGTTYYARIRAKNAHGDVITPWGPALAVGTLDP